MWSTIVSTSSPSRLVPPAVSAVALSGYVHADMNDVTSTAMTATAEWSEFARSWHDLPPDTHMADGGRYRRRRYSEFAFDAEHEALARLPHVAYSQPRSINHLNGGVDRHFEPLRTSVAASPVLYEVIRWCAGVIGALSEVADWKVQTFQNRIVARPEEAGQPTPEGMHRDGVDFVLTLLVDRRDVTGGMSSIYDARTHQCLAEAELATPGEFLLADDQRLLHAVTPLQSAAADTTGHRDVLIAMFSQRESATR